jgi:hypothetical protein
MVRCFKPHLGIASQGKTEKEVKENMADLINDYLNDPDTPKPSMEDLMSLSLTNIPVKVPEGVLHLKSSRFLPFHKYTK